MYLPQRFQSSFFPYCLSKWNQLELQNSLTFSSFKHSLLRFIRPTASLIYNMQYSRGLKLLTRLRVGPSHLHEHKFCQNFNDTIDPISYCRTNAIESVEHFLLQCHNHTHYRSSLFDNLCQNGISILPLSNPISRRRVCLFSNLTSCVQRELSF